MPALEQLISKLDSLILFLSFSHDEVFDLVISRKQVWFAADEITKLPETRDIFKNQISNSAFLLGYSYFEVFLYDILRKIYRIHPEILPHNKSISFREIIDCTHYDALIDRMIEKELNELFYKKMEDIIKYFLEKFNIIWTTEFHEDIIKASLIRNCLLHNNGEVDDKLSKFEGFILGDNIKMSNTDVHNYGLIVRKLVRDIYVQAEKNILIVTTPNFMFTTLTLDALAGILQTMVYHTNRDAEKKLRF